ncbi:MAG: hypothetical protein Q7W05_09665 [Deltaproteobacteria bacterium]|nr:hypothetical protein [Deltaproteobacteria bacterium]
MVSSAAAPQRGIRALLAMLSLPSETVSGKNRPDFPAGSKGGLRPPALASTIPPRLAVLVDARLAVTAVA